MDKRQSKPRVAIYVRVSTADQNLDLQMAELTCFAKARGWLIHKIYADKASGTNDDRPQLKALMAAARMREFDVLLAWKLDRFARSLKNLLNMLQDLEAIGVTFVSLKDQLDLSTPSGRLMAQMIGAFAEFEVSLIRERVRSGLREAKRKGIVLGRPIKIDKNKVVALRASGKSFSEIANELGCSRAGAFRIQKEQ